ncbi:MAG: hypothetical protein KJ985_12770, partial [Proteobacteria bacterium]|nr:hypothetical protein [Pseudomonadota bacterium]
TASNVTLGVSDTFSVQVLPPSVASISAAVGVLFILLCPVRCCPGCIFFSTRDAKKNIPYPVSLHLWGRIIFLSQ